VLTGIHKGLRESSCALLGGETAEMPGMYKRDEYDLAGFCVGIVDKDRIINGNNIEGGDAIIGLGSSGLHSNGFSLVRKVFSDNEIRRYARELLKPTRIYVKPVLSLLSVAELRLPAIKGIAHITGGSFYKKATKILPKGYGMIIDKKGWSVPMIFKIIQEKGNIEEREMYTVFNMGVGMILIIKPRFIKTALSKLSRFGLKTWVIGQIVKSDKEIEIV
jgi:phosphoribosylformylglycinamidine cyclo-ligase